MLKKILLLSAAVSATYITYAQESATVPTGFKYRNNFDLNISGGNNQFATNLAWTHFGILKKHKFKIGYGARFNSTFGSEKKFITAPARISTGRTGPLSFFSKPKKDQLDTLVLGNPQVNSLNLTINFQYSFSPRFDVGFTIDAIGFSFGNEQTGAFNSAEAPPQISRVQHATVTPFNVLLIGDNDIGTLNSELYLRYYPWKSLGISAGAGNLFVEYTTDDKLTFDNDRFRSKTIMFSLGLTYSPLK